MDSDSDGELSNMDESKTPNESTASEESSNESVVESENECDEESVGRVLRWKACLK